jgi:transcriptional regulator with XRE-family HTH domain
VGVAVTFGSVGDFRLIWGQRLKHRRLEIGKSQFALAVDVGVTPTAVAQWEQGATTPRDSLKPKVAEALETTPSELFAWPEEAA